MNSNKSLITTLYYQYQGILNNCWISNDLRTLHMAGCHIFVQNTREHIGVKYLLNCSIVARFGQRIIDKLSRIFKVNQRVSDRLL